MFAIIKQTFAVLLLAALIGLVLLLCRQPAESSGDDKGASAEEALKRYGFSLREVSKDVGIDFTHQAPTLDAQLDPIMPIIASMGASVSIVDFDRDGLPDVYVINSGEGSKNRLYRNMGDGTFKDVAEEMGVADLNQPDTGVCMGAVWGDFDNDGYEDLLVYKWGRPELFHNEGGKGFTRVTDKAGLPKWVNANSAVWLDFDGDGRLDLFIAGYWRDDLDLWHLKNTQMMPESFEYAKNGGRKYLLRNKGDGTFEDVTEKMGIKSTRWTLGVAAGSLCGSRYPDLFLANDYGVSELYVNRGGKGFIEIGERSGVGKAPKSGMNVSFGDVFNSGRFAVYVSNISARGNLVQGNNLWVHDEGGIGDKTRYTNQADSLGVELGAQFGITVLLWLAADHMGTLNVQSGNEVWPVLLVWLLGGFILYRLGRLHIPLVFLAAFVPLAFLRHFVTGNPWQTELAPVTWPMFQLYIFFMITDPKTTTRARWSQNVVVVVIAVVETALRLAFRDVHSLYHALFIVTPVTNLMEIVWDRHRSAIKQHDVAAPAPGDIRGATGGSATNALA